MFKFNKVKAIISIVLCLTTFSLLVLTASATSAVLNQTTFTVKEGDEINIIVSLKAAKGTESGDLTFEFDPAYLEFVKFAASSDFGSDGMCMGGLARNEDGTVVVNENGFNELTASLVFSEAATMDDFAIGTYTMKVLKTGTCAFRAKDGANIFWAGSDTPTFEFSVVTLEAAPDEPISEPTIEPKSEEPKSEEPKSEDEKTTKKPEEKTTKKPEEKTTKKPEEKTTKKPDEKTTKKPDEKTTKKSDATTKKSDATTKKATSKDKISQTGSTGSKLIMAAFAVSAMGVLAVGIKKRKDTI